MDDIPDRIDSKFRYVLLSAARAEQIIQGAPPKIEPQKRRTTRVAMDEIRRDVIDWDYGPAPEPEESGTGEAAEGDENSAES